MTGEVINLEDVTKYYFLKNRGVRERGTFSKFVTFEKFYALKNISLKINEGESVGIIGKNGSGKTILLKIISGIVYPNIGKALVRKTVSPVFEFGASFHPELTGFENIFLYSSLLGIRRKEINNKLNEIVAFSELRDFLNFKLKNYSTGMRVRLALSIISSLNPEILILDEALSAGDQGFVKKVHNRIFELQKNNVTMLITSHSVEILKKFCVRGIVLEKGNILYDGEISHAIKYYMGNVLMNDKVTTLKNSLVCL